VKNPFLPGSLGAIVVFCSTNHNFIETVADLRLAGYITAACNYIYIHGLYIVLAEKQPLSSIIVYDGLCYLSGVDVLSRYWCCFLGV
jgi:hypothetical protein